MATIVNFNLKKRDPEAFLICFLSIFRHFIRYRDNLKKTYLLPQIILWLEIDFLPNNPHTGLNPIRYFPRFKIDCFKINLQVYDLIFN
jgi:hypothetical protein